jgi:hypothetical protein
VADGDLGGAGAQLCGDLLVYCRREACVSLVTAIRQVSQDGRNSRSGIDYPHIPSGTLVGSRRGDYWGWWIGSKGSRPRLASHTATGPVARPTIPSAGAKSIGLKYRRRLVTRSSRYVRISAH